MNGCRILVGYLKAAMNWIGHVNRMDNPRKVSQVKVKVTPKQAYVALRGPVG
jgi:hypothetical protein